MGGWGKRPFPPCGGRWPDEVGPDEGGRAQRDGSVRRRSLRQGDANPRCRRFGRTDPPAHSADVGSVPIPAMVKGFGRRPLARTRRHGHGGRRSKAPQGGNRVQEGRRRRLNDLWGFEDRGLSGPSARSEDQLSIGRIGGRMASLFPASGLGLAWVWRGYVDRVGPSSKGRPGRRTASDERERSCDAASGPISIMMCRS